LLKKSIGANTLALGMFALVTSLLLAGTNIMTRDQIAESERQAAEKALLEIVPAQRHNNSMLTDTVPIPKSYWPLLGLSKGGEAHIARKDGEIQAVIVPAIAPDGYSGDIKLIVGVNTNGTVAGVRVLGHSETPGLGDKIDLKKSQWILHFNGTSLLNPPATQWRVKKDGGYFDQFTGATITPRAVISRVKSVLEYFGEDYQRISRLAPGQTNRGETDE
jgi:Na+-translocating ferredoxin:NAD+ oxidoreductase subunit G